MFFNIPVSHTIYHELSMWMLPPVHIVFTETFTVGQCISIIVQKISSEKFNSSSVLVRD